ncbi:HPr kinase/phosphorylase [Roseibium salinum]|uniref:HPr kinase/phosphatase C-terminal domain-containing protein n=1 Tax=Roseibium salinum TaxID=1604349 RepID=A0ABT3R575_9HYPH|nr:HPr kinase/phosphatase C-terminal domain-containing protein [Roseibium sp. DSM 29163]MCX2724383.1 HPr kinase/phosphatase C-terminal domain-containing protein [Roseibium sp. DSM 29163]MDN3721582.1 HPr kinase/phosphatase C-terminal domain-containing protein [Roseibium salinum]
MTRQSVHATCVVVGTHGVLIRGDAGSGKSSLAETLLEAARAKGNFAALVADDRVLLDAERDRVLARVPETIQGMIEVRGVGLEEIAFEPVACVDLIVDLKPPEAIDRLPDPALASDLLEGISLPLLSCPSNDPGTSLRQIRWAFRELFPETADYI